MKVGDNFVPRSLLKITMVKFKCDNCGKVLKTKAGLARHTSTSMACMQARNHLEFMSGKEQDKYPSGKKSIEKDQKQCPIEKEKRAFSRG